MPDEQSGLTNPMGNPNPIGEQNEDALSIEGKNLLDQLKSKTKGYEYLKIFDTLQRRNDRLEAIIES